jgi:hypothetical protein
MTDKSLRDSDKLEIAWLAFASQHPDIANRDIAMKAVFFAGFKAGVDESTDMFHEVLRNLTIQMETRDES